MPAGLEAEWAWREQTRMKKRVVWGFTCWLGWLLLIPASLATAQQRGFGHGPQGVQISNLDWGHTVFLVAGLVILFFLFFPWWDFRRR